MVNVDGGILEAGDENTGKIFVVFDEQDVGGAFSLVQDAAQFGEEEIFVEGFLNPALSVAGELRTQRGGENAEDNNGDVCGDGVIAKALQGLPSAEAGHVEIEEDSFDVVLGGEDKGLFPRGGFDDGVALAGEVLGYYGADAGIVVADQDCAFAAGGKDSTDCHVGGAGGAGKHDVESGSE